MEQVPLAVERSAIAGKTVGWKAGEGGPAGLCKTRLWSRKSSAL